MEKKTLYKANRQGSEERGPQLSRVKCRQKILVRGLATRKIFMYIQITVHKLTFELATNRANATANVAGLKSYVID